MRRNVKESYVKRKVREILKEHGAWYCMPVGGPYGRRGIPDFLVCLNGRLVGIETKAGRNKPTQLQVQQLRQIEEADGIAIVVNERNLESLSKLLEAIRFYTQRATPSLCRGLYPDLYSWDS